MTVDELRAIVERDAAYDIDPETDRLVYFWRGKPVSQVTDPAAVRDRRALLALLRETREALALDAPLLHHFVHPDTAFDDCDSARCTDRRARLAILDPTETPTE